MRLGELDERQADALAEYFLAVERRRRAEIVAPLSAIPAIDLGARLGTGCRFPRAPSLRSDGFGRRREPDA